MSEHVLIECNGIGIHLLSGDTAYMESSVDPMFNGFTCYQETIERRNTGYHVNIHDLYKKYLIDDRMKALDLNEQVLLKRRITIIHVDDVKMLDIAHDCSWYSNGSNVHVK